MGWERSAFDRAILSRFVYFINIKKRTNSFGVLFTQTEENAMIYNRKFFIIYLITDWLFFIIFFYKGIFVFDGFFFVFFFIAVASFWVFRRPFQPWRLLMQSLSLLQSSTRTASAFWTSAPSLMPRVCDFLFSSFVWQFWFWLFFSVFASWLQSTREQWLALLSALPSWASSATLWSWCIFPSTTFLSEHKKNSFFLERVLLFVPMSF